MWSQQRSLLWLIWFHKYRGNIPGKVKFWLVLKGVQNWGGGRRIGLCRLKLDTSEHEDTDSRPIRDCTSSKRELEYFECRRRLKLEMLRTERFDVPPSLTVL